MTTLVTPLRGAAAVTTSAAPVLGQLNVYNATSAALTPALPALSGLNVGAVAAVQKSTADSSANTVTVSTASGDFFDDGSSTTTVLRVSGELRHLQVVTVGSTKYWKVIAGYTPLTSFDSRYLAVGVRTTATAAGTTTLTSSDAVLQQFTGTTTQTVVLPSATTLTNGTRYQFSNRSTGIVTVQTNGAATLQALAAGATAYVTLISNGTAAGTWDVDYEPVVGNTGSILKGSGTNGFAAAVAGTDFFGPTVAVPAANLPNGITNFNVASQSQTTVSGTSYYVAGSALALPATLKTGLVANKSTYVWNVTASKDAASTGNTFQLVIFRGTLGTTADTADVTQTISGAGTTAVADQATFEVQLTVTATGATGSYYWSIVPTHVAASATGFGTPTGLTGQFSGTVSSVALNTASLTFGIGFKSTTGTQPTIVIPQVQALTYNIV